MSMEVRRNGPLGKRKISAISGPSRVPGRYEYECFKPDASGENEWYEHGRRYGGLKGVLGLLSGGSREFVVDCGVLAEVWNYVQTRFDPSKVDEVRERVTSSVFKVLI